MAVIAASAIHFAHLGARFGRAALIIRLTSAVIWSVGYGMQAVNPNPGVLSSWYSVLFMCYGEGHVLTAVSLVLVAFRKAALER